MYETGRRPISLVVDRDQTLVWFIVMWYCLGVHGWFCMCVCQLIVTCPNWPYTFGHGYHSNFRPLRGQQNTLVGQEGVNTSPVCH
jgi:hypothetical protein